MVSLPYTGQFATIYGLAVKLSVATDADALLVMLGGSTDWKAIKKAARRTKILVVADLEEELEEKRRLCS